MRRAQHAGVHVIGSVVVLGLFGSPLPFILLLAVMEWIVHFHIDFAKARYSEVKNLNPQQARFWQAMGADQTLHQLTYIAMGWAWIKFVAL